MSGFDVKIKLDFRSFVASIRQSEPVTKLISVTKNPSVKEDIYRDIWERRDEIFVIPKDTGALQNSPEADAPMPYTAQHGKRTITRYANGGIDTDGIHFDPYQVSVKTGNIHYYGAAVFQPMWDIRDNMPIIKEIVKDHIIEGYRDE